MPIERVLLLVSLTALVVVHLLQLAALRQMERRNREMDETLDLSRKYLTYRIVNPRVEPCPECGRMKVEVTHHASTERETWCGCGIKPMRTEAMA